MPHAQSFVLTTSPAHSPALTQALDERPWLVVGLCAAWCNTCGTFFDDFEALATTRPDATFVWLDIEDDAEIVGDIDVDNFPTIAVYRHGRLVHFGVSLPQIGLVRLVLSALDQRSATVAAGAAVTALPARLAAVAEERTALRAPV